MMTKLRELSKIFIIIVAISFIALMVFEWGMDYSGRSRQNNVVGEVNGNKLTYDRFNDLYQQLYEEQRARARDVQFTEEDLQHLRDQVWERFIQRTLFEEQMEKLGIAVSDSEIVYQILNYPLEDFKQVPYFQTDGQFDMKKYQQSVLTADPNIPWNQVEQIYRSQIPFIKLQNIISNTVRVTPLEVREAYKDQNLKAKVEYLGIAANAFNSPDITVTDEEIEAFYKKHTDEYKQNEQRALSYVEFPIETTAADTAHLFSEFERIRARIEAGESFNELVLEYSEAPAVGKNKGDLGYFEKGAMVKPFEEAAFNANPGDLVGPVETSFGYHMILVEDKKVEDGEEKVKASHILMKISPAPSTIEEQESRARLFSLDAKDNSFQETARASDYEVKQTPLFEEGGGFIPGIGNNLALLNFAFASKLNEVSNVYRVEDKYIVATVSQIEPAGYKDLELVKRFIENRVKLAKAKERARTVALSIKDKISPDADFEKIAANDTTNKVRHNITDPFTIDASVPGVGRFVEFNATAFALNEGEVSDLIETERGFYYQKLLEKTEFDSTAFAMQQKTLARNLLSQKRQQIFADWYNDLKEEATIVDNRKMFSL